MKRMTIRLLILAVIGTLSACSFNRVETVSGSETVLKYSSKKGFEDRFVNLYKRPSDYPANCEEDCYPANEAIQCKAEMESCQYIGPKRQSSSPAGFDIQWFGHASFKITTKTGEQFLIDPVFGQFDSPVHWAYKWTGGIYRKPPAALSKRSMAETDAVLYSHIHYDHFNKADIKTIGANPSYLVPMGFADHFPTAGFNIVEMPWFGQKSIAKTIAHFVPAHHFSSRIWIPFLYNDDDKTLWGGWVLESLGKKLFYAGDTGYSPHFKDIAAKYGTMDVCLLPIASYHSEEYPKWYRNVHTTPEDALVAAQELGCKSIVPWGYGNASWKMGDHSSHSALFRLLKMHEQLNVDIPLVILNEGEQITL